jgi:translation initiation factor IF-3
LRVNERIRVSQVRVIAEDGSQLGVMSPQDALRIARERGFDLVEVAPQATPPVCRIIDFNKFRYEQARREREAKKKHHLAKLKEVKFKPHIETHDYQVKLQQLKRFLTRGDKAKVTMVFRGREMAHLEIGRRVLDRLVVDLKAIGRVERDPILEGRFMTMIFSPDHAALRRAASQQRPKAPRPESAQPAGPPPEASSAASAAS